MAKGAYIGVSGTARKIKKGYIGVGGKARPIKKAYIGVGGVARPCWSGGELAYYGTADLLTCGIQAHGTRKELASATAGEYALFSGGTNNFHFSGESVVDVCSKQLVHSTAPPFGGGVTGQGAANAGNQALFAGGRTGQESSSAKVFAYSASLVQSIPTSLKSSRIVPTGGSIGDYALFAGGLHYYYEDGESYSESLAAVDVYQSTLTQLSATPLATANSGMGATSIGNYVLFAGGNSVDAYSASLVHSIPSALGITRDGIEGASIGEYALFAGGCVYSNKNGYTVQSVVDIYNKGLTKLTSISLATARALSSAATLEGCVLFVGGSIWAKTNVESGLNSADAFNESLTRINISPLPVPRNRHTAVAIGEYAVIAGGRGGDLADAGKCDIYTLN